MATAAEKRPEVKDPYYYESDTEDGELVTFEAGAWVGRDRGDHHYVEGGPLAMCDMPATWSRPLPGRRYDCPNPAIALIRWGGGGKSKVCREHYDDIRQGFAERAVDVEE